MKLLTISLLLASGIAFAVDIVSPAGSLPEAMITAKVTDENATPLKGVKVSVAFEKFVPLKTIESAPVSGMTNAAGEFAAKGRSAGQRVGGSAEAPGYYRSTFSSPLLQSTPDKKWNPWNPIINVILKKVEKPVPMHAKKVDTDVPVSDEAVGFDLLEGEWVAPHGRGKTPDLLFTLTRRFSNVREYDSRLSVGFAQPADGFQVWDNRADYLSALKMPRWAPEAGYVQPLVLSNKRLPGATVERDLREERNYFIRVRTVVDQQGRVASALYGKIDGDIRFSPIRSKTCSLMFTYYLNPTPNDRNMEFDPQRNLLTGLKDQEKVTVP